MATALGASAEILRGKGGRRFGSKVGAVQVVLFPVDVSSAMDKAVLCLEQEGWRLADTGKCMQRC